MENKCLVTKLDCLIDKDIDKLGVIKAKIIGTQATVGSYGSITTHNGGVVTFVLEDGTTRSFNLPSTQYFDFSSEQIGQTLEIHNYYAINSLSATLISFDIKAFAFCTWWNGDANLRNSVELTGDISSLYRLTDVVGWYFPNNVEGSVNKLAQKMYEYGKTSGTVYVVGNGTTKIKANGINLGNKTSTITFDSSLPDGFSVSDPT